MYNTGLDLGPILSEEDLEEGRLGGIAPDTVELFKGGLLVVIRCTSTWGLGNRVGSIGILNATGGGGNSGGSY